MNFLISSEEDELLQTSSRRFLADCDSFDARREGKALPASQAWQRMAELGWFALATPESLGGAGSTPAQMLLLLQEAGRALSLASLSDNLLVAPAVFDRLPTERVEGFVAGEVRFAFLQAGVRRSPIHWHDDGEGRLLIEGNSSLAAGAPTATHFIVSALHRNDSQAGLFCIPTDAPGITLAPQCLLDDMQAARVHISGSWLRSEVAIDTSRSAAARIALLEDRAAAAAAAQAFGAADAGFWLTLDYLKQRVQFGKPLSRLQAIQHMMADAFCSLEQQRSLQTWLAGVIDADVATRQHAVSAAKSFLGGRTRMAVETCIQLSGGIGVTDEYALGHYYKRLLVQCALGGDADAHLRRLARLARHDTQDHYGAAPSPVISMETT